jgi:hypothetical protein
MRFCQGGDRMISTGGPINLGCHCAEPSASSIMADWVKGIAALSPIRIIAMAFQTRLSHGVIPADPLVLLRA